MAYVYILDRKDAAAIGDVLVMADGVLCLLKAKGL